MQAKIFIRKFHKYLSLFIGLQLLLWTLSGLYFSWTDINSVRGNQFKQDPANFPSDIQLASPDKAISLLRQDNGIEEIVSLRLINVLGDPTYQLKYIHQGQAKILLINGKTGRAKAPLSQTEAINLAKSRVISSAIVYDVKLLVEVDEHHEVRGRALPLYQISFKDPDITAYVNPRLGTFETVRHDQWRIFDFLWMLHTMDYQGRDDFNHWLIKLFSVFAFIAVASGFILYFSSRRKRAA